VSAPDRLIDARGMLCPWPVLRLGRAARELGPGASIRILADDPIAPGELAQLCRERGWRIDAAGEESGCWDVVTA